MYSRRVVYALGFVVLFLCCTSLALASDVDYPFITDTQKENYPVYFILGFYTGERSISSVPTQYASPAPTAWDMWSNTSSNNNTLPASKLMQAMLLDMQSKGSIVGFNSLSDYDPNSYPYNYIVQLSAPAKIDIVNANLQTSGDGISYACVLKASGNIFVRNVNPDSSVNVNTLSSAPSTLYDVFYCLFLTNTYVASDVLFGGTLILNTNNHTPNLYFSAYNRTSINYSFTRFLMGHFRFDSDTGSLVQFDSGRFGLPFTVNETEPILYFCRGSVGYWSYGGASSYPSDSPGSTVLKSPLILTKNLARPLYSGLTVQYVDSFERLEGISSDPNLTYASWWYDRDSDNGSMTDFHEWYQTKHNLLDPSDDRQNTPEIEPPAENLPEPEEGETVVDIGKDTVDRYGHYWDEQVGDYFDLEPVQPPTSSPEPPAFNFEQFDVESISRRVRGNLEETGLESSMETVFSPLSSSDTPINLTFTPTVDFSSLGSTLQLNTLDLNPSNVLGMNSRSVSDAAQKFKIFRFLLVVVEILLFGYSCFKLVFNMLSPGNSDSGSQQGEE